jgi:hypothetical protein
MAQVTDWLCDPASGLPSTLRDALDTRLRATLRELLLVERRLVPRGDLAEMTGGSR